MHLFQIRTWIFLQSLGELSCCLAVSSDLTFFSISLLPQTIHLAVILDSHFFVLVMKVIAHIHDICLQCLSAQDALVVLLLGHQCGPG